MNPKTIVYLAVLFAAMLLLVLGGWLVKGAKALAGRSRQPELRARYA